jgi:hypothetical protein
MLKLLLKEEKQKIKKEYLLRFLAVFLLGMAFVLFLLSISLLPSYYLLLIDKKVLTQELSVVQDIELNADRRRLREKLASLRDTLSIVDEPTTEISPYIQKITSNQPRDINILGLSFTKENKQEKIVLDGVANNRNSLANFVNILDQIPEFQTVNLPFSSFVRDSDIPFSITITIEQKS